MDQQTSRFNSAENLQLEEECNVCGGVGKEDTEEGEWRCDECNGSGMMPTVLGQRILTLMSHHATSLRLS